MELLELKNPYLLPFNFKKLKSGRFFISNIIGESFVMDKEVFENFVQGGKIDDELITLLVRKGFMKPSKKDTNYVKYLAYRWLLRYKYLLQGPSLHILVMTLSCNHVCKYCHASAKMDSGKKYHMSKNMAKKVVDMIFETTAGNITIEFQGGEPLANWDIVKFVIEYAKEKNKERKLELDFALVTNLTMMTDEIMNYLLDNDIGISTSLDGPKELHDDNRKYLGEGSSFEKVTHWIKKINEQAEKKGVEDRVGAIATATRKSLSMPKEIVDTYVNNGLDSVFIRPLNPFGFAEKIIDDIGYSQDEYVEFYNQISDYISELREKGVKVKDSYGDICLYNMTAQERANYMEERSPCGAVLGQVAYNYDGGIYTCDEGRMLGAVGDDTFKVLDIGLKKTSKQLYKDMILSHVTKSLASASLIDFIPGYDTNPISAFIGTCPIYSYKQSGNIISKYKKEQRFQIQEGVVEKLLKDITK